MYNVIFDTEKVIPQATLEAEALRFEKLIHTFLDDKCAGDDFKARHKLLTMFSSTDYNGHGWVNQKEFASVLGHMNLFPPGQVLSHWFHTYTTDSDDQLDYKVFANQLYNIKSIPARNKVAVRAITDVRQKILERGAGAMKGLSRTFRIMDKNRNQKLSPDEFRVGLQRYGLEYEDDVFAEVCAAFDRDGDGISVTEFLRALRGQLSDRRKQLVELAFKQLDRDRSGVCEFKEICGIYDATRHPEVLAKRKTVEEVLLEFIKCWDRDGDGRITLLEFIDYYKDISCSIDNDDYFELMIRNAWHLAGGKGWCANTSNLRVLVVHDDDSEEVVCITNDLGLDKDDDAALRAALQDQGVECIKRVELAF